MKVSVVGAGPAGLFFAILLKRKDATHEIIIYEQLSANTTYGFGVGFSKAALDFLKQTDSKLHKDIINSSEHLERLTIVHKGDRISIAGNDFYGIERLCLLNLLKKEALAIGVQIIENHRIEVLHNLRNCDLIVGADGINSIIRSSFSKRFKPIIKKCKNKLIWYATSRISNGIELIFKETDVGLFIGHTYRYKYNKNTFVIECGSSTWRAAGLDAMSDAQSRSYCENIFSEYLEGCPLISNQSFWFTPKIVKSTSWMNGNITLIGDALKTMHPSIGSGTRVAMQDAMALADACQEHPRNIESALKKFEESRRAKVEKLQEVAIQSIRWYESVSDLLHLSPFEFAYDYMMRTGKLTHEKIREMDPTFIREYESRFKN